MQPGFIDLHRPISNFLNYVESNIKSSLKYQRCTPSGCADIGIRIFEFIAASQSLCCYVAGVAETHVLYVDTGLAIIILAAKGTNNIFKRNDGFPPQGLFML